jgi:hypothetical protein
MREKLLFGVALGWALCLGQAHAQPESGNAVSVYDHAQRTDGRASMKRLVEKGTDARVIASNADDYKLTMTSSSKYVTLHFHYEHNCSLPIRYNVTFRTDTCINATLPFNEAVNSISFFHNSEPTGWRLNDDYFRHNDTYLLTYFDDSCSPKDHNGADDGETHYLRMGGCEHGFSQSFTDELPEVKAAESYIRLVRLRS